MQSCFLLKKKKRTKENKSDTEDTDVKGGMNVRIQRQLKNEIKEKRSTRISTRVKQKKKNKKNKKKKRKEKYFVIFKMGWNQCLKKMARNSLVFL